MILMWEVWSLIFVLGSYKCHGGTFQCMWLYAYYNLESDDVTATNICYLLLDLEEMEYVHTARILFKQQVICHQTHHWSYDIWKAYNV